MARYPARTPAWALQPYGEESYAWDDAKRQCRAVLYAWAAAGKCGSYSELTRSVTAIAWPEGAYTHHGQQMGYLLGQVALEELDRFEQRPVISALVIGQEEGMPTAGFWKFIGDELGMRVPASDDGRLKFWVDEFRAACSFYGSRAAAGTAGHGGDRP